MLQVDHLRITYPVKGGSFLAVDDVTFSLAKSRRLAIIGPSGSGKTTILKAVAGLLPRYGGKIRFEGGYDPAGARAARLFGFVPQNRSLIPWKTTFENVALPLKIIGRGARETDKTVTELLDTMGLLEFKDYYPDQLSGGMQARVAIARALAVSPELVILDEGMGSLDELTRETIAHRLSKDWIALGTTVLFVTHSIHEAVILADDVLVLSSLPARNCGFVAVDEPQPRGTTFMTSAKYLGLVNRIRQLIGLTEGVNHLPAASSA